MRGSRRPNTVILSRTDRLGDVVLSLPMAGILKELYPDCRVIFLARTYTMPVLEACEHVDGVLAWDEIRDLPPKEAADRLRSTGAETFIHVFTRREVAALAKQARIPLRVGTRNRFYHLHSCNKLVALSRRRSKLHEAQLNLKLLVPFGARRLYRLDSIPSYYGLNRIETLEPALAALLSRKRFNLVIHPRTGGSAPEWGLDRFADLMRQLPTDAYKLFVTGTAEESESIRAVLPLDDEDVCDLTGKLTMTQLISFIRSADGLVAGSTGPLHVAAALGKKAIGVYAPYSRTHPRRWSPVGTQATALFLEKKCRSCPQGEGCECIRSITPARVMAALEDGRG